MTDDNLQEDLVMSWIKITGILKNNRITKYLSYNEAIIMLFAYNEYKTNGRGISFKQLVLSTKMMKSLVNRTVNSLKDRGLVTISSDENDKRSCIISIAADKLDVFLAVHSQSLALSEKIISVIGEDDARAFLGMVEKIDKAKLKLLDEN